MIEEIKKLVDDKQYHLIKEKILELEEADIAEILVELDTKNLIKIFTYMLVKKK